MRRSLALIALLAPMLLTGCPQGPVEAKFSLADDAAFFDAPFPIFTRVRADGTARWSDFPNPDGNPLVAAYIAAVDAGPKGFATQGAVYFPMTGAIDPATLPPTPEASAAPGASAYLIDVDPASPERGHRLPSLVHYAADGAKYRAAHLVAVLPHPGLVLRPGTLYAAVLTRAVRDAQGQPLPIVAEVGQTRAGQAPAGPNGAAMFALYANLWDTLDLIGEADEDVVVATVFRTQDPVSEQAALADYVRSGPAPEATELFQRADHPGFCVIEGRVDFPIFQDGERPYLFDGGEIHFDEMGAPIVQWTENVRFALSVPKGAMPAAGWPIVLWANGTGGSYLSVMNRGVGAGQGPAKFYAARGIAALDTDPVLHGPRSPSGDPDGTLFFNPLNPIALRDTIRQSAVELTVLASLAENLAVDPALCPGVDASAAADGMVHYDPERILFMGQSTGSTVGPVGMAADRRMRAGVFSGASGNWILQVVLKQSPFPLNPAISLVLGVWPSLLDEFEPVLTLIQTLWDPADPTNYARWLYREDALSALDAGAPGAHVFKIQGILDTYSTPPQGAAFAAAMGMDLVEPVVEPSQIPTIALAGRGVIAPPASLNNAEGPAPVTAAYVQYAAEPGHDGHYVSFDQDAPKYQYGCFFETFAATGAPVIFPRNDDPLAACTP
ncbi:MAG: hypothetical protein KC466_08920 [Myxococcales bacterium]|nr:hypothetical protein [Myxococcales bacterium]